MNNPEHNSRSLSMLSINIGLWKISTLEHNQLRLVLIMWPHGDGKYV